MTEIEKITYKTMTSRELNREFKRIVKNIVNNEEKNEYEKLSYILAGDDLDIHADIHIDDDWAILCAVLNQDYVLIKYLLSSEELDEHSNINNKNIRQPIFIYAYENYYINNNKGMLEKLIYDYNFKYDDDFILHIRDGHISEIKNEFLLKELRDKLKDNLKERTVDTKMKL